MVKDGFKTLKCKHDINDIKHVESVDWAPTADAQHM